MSEKETLSWVQTLNKQEISAELCKRDVQVEKSEKFDTLREKLRELIRKELQHSEKSGDTKQVEESESAANNNNSVTDDPTVQQISEVEEDSDMADGIKVEYRLHKDDWETFTEQIEQLFIARSITEEKKAAHLLVRVDQATGRSGEDKYEKV